MKFGAAAIVNGAADKQLTDEDLDQILDRTRGGNATLGVVKGNQASDAASFKSDTQAVSLREFEGATYGAKREKRATLGDLSANSSSRRSGNGRSACARSASRASA